MILDRTVRHKAREAAERAEFARQCEWHRVFAWWPVEVREHVWVWLEHVECRYFPHEWERDRGRFYSTRNKVWLGFYAYREVGSSDKERPG